MATDTKRIKSGVFVMTHYNILAEAYGSNLKPWFLYGTKPAISPALRERIFEKYSAKDDNGNLLYSGFEKYTQGLLTTEQQEQIEAYDASFFAWKARKWKILDKIVENRPDIVTLAECDNYKEFFQEQLEKKGNLKSVWIQRPERRDGSCLAWKDSRYEMLAKKQLNFSELDKSGMVKVDTRTALLVYLKERSTTKRLVAITTHLSRSAEDMDLEWARARQVIQLGIALYEFVQEHTIPVSCAMVLGGDLNCFDMKRLITVGNVITWLCDTKAHSFFYSPKIIETEATSQTQMREAQIDYVAYAQGSLDVKALLQRTRFKGPMPNRYAPSDHHPVSVTFRHLDDTSFKEFSSLRFLKNLIKRQKNERMEHLTTEELTAGYESFCTSRSGVAADTLDLRSPRFSQLCRSVGASPNKMIPYLQERKLDLLGDKSISAITFEQFSTLYYRLEFEQELPNKKVYMEVFDFMDADNSKMLEPNEIRLAIEKATGAQVNEARYKEVMADMDTNSDNKVSAEEFMDWIIKLHKRMHSVN